MVSFSPLKGRIAWAQPWVAGTTVHKVPGLKCVSHLLRFHVSGAGKYITNLSDIILNLPDIFHLSNLTDIPNLHSNQQQQQNCKKKNPLGFFNSQASQYSKYM